MANIKDKITQIRQAIFGKEVRESIASGIESINKEVENTTARQDNVEAQFQAVLDETTDKDIISAPEITAARVGADNSTYANLKERLDKENQEVMSQLADVVGDIKSIWDSPNQPALIDIIPTTNYQNFIDKYEELRTQFPNYINREILGMDSSGTYEIYKYIFTPQNYEKTVILQGGIHGNEQVGIMLLYRFMYHLCYDYKKYPQLNYAKNKIRFIIIPVLNPYGFNQNQRTNSNGVDLNRNFDYKWDSLSSTEKGTSAMSEIETQYVDNVLTEYNDAVGFIDFHNTGVMPDRDFYCSVPRYGYNHNIALSKIMENVAPTSDYVTHINYSDDPMTHNYGQFKKGITSMIVETVQGAFGATPYESEDMTNAFKFISNVILYLINLEKLKVIELNEPKAFTFYYNYPDFSTSSTSFVEVPKSVFTISPKTGGILILNGSVILASDDTTYNKYAVPVITQANNPIIPNSSETVQETHYQVFGRESRITLPLNRVVQILPKNNSVGDVVFKIKVKVEDGVSIQVQRIRLNFIFIPSDNWNVENYRINNNGDMVLESPKYV